MLDPQVGPLEPALAAVGLGGGGYLADPGVAIMWLALVQVWAHAGQLMVVYIAGLQQIPQVLYEAAEVDGASRWERFRYVTLPLIAPTGLIVLASFISPFRSERRMARELLQPGEFVEVFVDTPIELAEARDAKGLYRKAREGTLSNFTGVDSPYEAPEAPELRLDGAALSAESAAEAVLAHLRRLDEGST